MATKIVIDEEVFDKLFEEARDKMDLKKLKEIGFKRLGQEEFQSLHDLYRHFIYEMFGLKDKIKKGTG